MNRLTILKFTAATSEIRSDRVARAFVWAVWIVMLLVALASLAQYGRNLPLTEDWLLVPPLTGNEPDLINWLWAQNNEHRLPLPRLMMLGLLKATDGDFRAGMFFNIITLGTLAFAMIRTARHLRGGRTRFADAFLPIALLHLGHWENLFWTWQLVFVFGTALTCTMLLVLVGFQTLTRPSAAIIAGFSLVLLSLVGANGLLFVPFLALWFGYCGFLHWYSDKTEGGGRWIGGFLIGSAAVAVCFTGLYFVGYERPSWTPPNPGLWPSLRAATQFLALGFGPVVRSSWMLPIMIAIGVFLTSLGVAVLGVLRHRGLEKYRALGILVFFSSLALLALAMGWGRAGVIALDGRWPLRYVLLAVPAFCAAYFVWELYGHPKLRSVVQSGLFFVMLLLLPFNTAHGLWWRDWYLEGADAVEHDLAQGTSPSALAERHHGFLFHSIEPDRLTDLIRMLQNAGMEPFVYVREEPIESGDLLPNENLTQVPQIVTREFRYHMPEAGEVFLVWGINGWNVAPETIRPVGTLVKDEVMHTQMTRKDDTFIARLQVPAGTTIDYGFLITKKRDGTGAYVWEANGDQDYHMIAHQDGYIELETRVTLVQNQVPANLTDISLATQEFRYNMPEAGEVFLVWGIEGWRPVAEEIRPAGTVVKVNAMHTPMALEGDTFVVQIQAPAGTAVDYGFLITKAHNGTAIKAAWDGDQDYQMIVSEDSVVEVESTLTLAQDQTLVRFADAPLKTQEFRYDIPEAGEVFLVWGIEGWQPLAAAIRPAGTVIKDGIMRTPMDQEGDAFVATVKIPSGAALDYGFLITDRRGIFDLVRPIWDGDQDYQMIVSEDNLVEVKSKLTLANELSYVHDTASYFLVGIGLLLGSWVLIFLLLGLLDGIKFGPRSRIGPKGPFLGVDL